MNFHPITAAGRLEQLERMNWAAPCDISQNNGETFLLAKGDRVTPEVWKEITQQYSVKFYKLSEVMLFSNCEIIDFGTFSALEVWNFLELFPNLVTSEFDEFFTLPSLPFLGYFEFRPL